MLHSLSSSPAGAVAFQLERHYCCECRRDRTAIRAVRLSDGWHSDWRCTHEAWPGMSLGPAPYRRPVKRSPAPLDMTYADGYGFGPSGCDCSDPVCVYHPDRTGLEAEDSAQADLFDSPVRTDFAPYVQTNGTAHIEGTKPPPPPFDGSSRARELLARLQERSAKRSAEHTNCGAVDPIADFVCVRAAGHPGVHRSPHGGVTWPREL